MPPRPENRLPNEVYGRIAGHGNHSSRVGLAAQSPQLRELMASGIQTRASNGRFTRTIIAGSSTPHMSAGNLHSFAPSLIDVTNFAEGLHEFHMELCKVAQRYDAQQQQPQTRNQRCAFIQRLFKISKLKVNMKYYTNVQDNRPCYAVIKVTIMPGATIKLWLDFDTTLRLESYKFKGPRGACLEREFTDLPARAQLMKQRCKPNKFWGDAKGDDPRLHLTFGSTVRQGQSTIKAVIHDVQLVQQALNYAYRNAIPLRIDAGDLLGVLRPLFRPIMNRVVIN